LEGEPEGFAHGYLALSESFGAEHAAYGAIRSALAEARDCWARARMLPAQLGIAIAAGDLATVRASAEELGGVSAAFDSPALRASMHDGWGRVLLTEGVAGGEIVASAATAALAGSPALAESRA